MQQRPHVHPPTFNHRIVYQKERSTGMETLSLQKNHRDLCHDHTPRLWVNPFSFLPWIRVARLQDERRSRWWAGRFPFIGVPRDVIVLSVSIVPLVFPQIAARCMAWVTMLECIAPLSLAVENIKIGWPYEGMPAGIYYCSLEHQLVRSRKELCNWWLLLRLQRARTVFKWYTDHIMSAGACCAVWLSRGCFI